METCAANVSYELLENLRNIVLTIPGISERERMDCFS